MLRPLLIVVFVLIVVLVIAHAVQIDKRLTRVYDCNDSAPYPCIERHSAAVHHVAHKIGDSNTTSDDGSREIKTPSTLDQLDKAERGIATSTIESLGWQCTGPSTLTSQVDRRSMMREWYRMMSSARRHVALSTYHWYVLRQRCGKIASAREVCPQIMALGLGMARNPNKDRVHISILINRDPWSRTSFIEGQIAEAYAVWRALGANVDAITFYVWNQTLADNMHIKLLVQDDEAVNVTSGNVQYSYDEWADENSPERLFPHYEGENSVTVRDNVAIVRASRTKFWELCKRKKCSRYTVRDLDHIPTWQYTFRNYTLCLSYEGGKKELHAIPFSEYEAMLRDRKPGEDDASFGEAGILFTPDRVNLWNATFPKELVPLMRTLRSARSSIIVMTPNFGDATIWNELRLAMKRGATVRLITGKLFNSAWKAAKYATGLRSNVDMLENVAQPHVKEDGTEHLLQWYWYGWKGRPLTSTAPRYAHHKVFMIDDHLTITGSLNCHVFSIYNVAETMLCVDSAKLYKQTLDTLVTPKLENAQRVM